MVILTHVLSSPLFQDISGGAAPTERLPTISSLHENVLLDYRLQRSTVGVEALLVSMTARLDA